MGTPIEFVSRPYSDKGRDEHDRIFGKKDTGEDTEIEDKEQIN